jgi:hypothetical protein
MNVFPFLLCGLLVGVASVSAQTRVVDHNAHGWYTYFGDHPLGESTWGVHLEGQYRRHEVIRQWQQLLLRPGVNYQARRNLLLTGGYAYVRSFPYGQFPAQAATNEHRLWEQAWLRYKTGRVAWSTRVRFENRFIGGASPGAPYRYQNRIRSWQQVTVPLAGRMYVTGYDEVWFHVKPYTASSPFDQNRAYAALGWNLSPSWRLEAGYMNQLLLQRSGQVLESNHTLYLSVLSTARLKR